ncbi:D-2-hydroxyacid dehydrogenase [Proteocatella sphenisci]|uniref:D-2-hydroxyacid dehydrogenase n=1 Tax=Proteocatella sphenisci TaxID=181070 RepID=UPI0004AD6CB8|nr:D-2-hydroxyacid dehydrogenase [Proteocatella sphenisci]
MRILANDGIDKIAADEFTKRGFLLDKGHYDKEELKTKIRDFEVLIVRSATRVDRDIIDAATYGKLRLIVRAGVGIDNIDAGYAKEKGIEVRNTPNASSDSVAELVLGHMFCLARFISISNVTMRDGKWNKKEYEGIELAGKTLGVIGFGRIGRSLAEKASALGMQVIFHDTCVKNHEKFEYTEFEKLVENADFISVHTPYTGSAVIGEKEFEKMKKGVFIINAARGNVIDEKALLQALNTDRVSGAGVDVFEKEPAVNFELVNHPKVCVTPHIGSATKEAQMRIGRETIETIIDFFDNIIDKAI